MSSSLTIQAPAKLNLALAVGPASRADGLEALHPIASWMVTVNLYDELGLRRLDRGSISRYAILWHADAKRRSDINWSITKDLAVRAHLALERHVGEALPIQLKLEKRIPVGSGLGGGSSDAAAMLRGLNALFSLGLSAQELASIGSTLGSDIPYLVHGGSALVEGFGERIALHSSLPPIHAVIAFPAVACATARVYRLYDEMRDEVAAGSTGRFETVAALARSGTPRPHAPFNDLAPAAMRCAPELHVHLTEISSLAERPAHITGSGSAIFVLCDEPIHAEALASAIEQRLTLPAVAVRSCEVNRGSD